MVRPLEGKTAVVTGATSGIGFEASVTLAALGAHVVLVGRNRARGAAALAALKERAGSGTAALLFCDFSSLKQIRGLAADIIASCRGVHILVNNAGGVNLGRELTEDGIERTFGVNHLAPFLLTTLLLDLLKRSAPARVVTVSSAAHRMGDMPFDNLQFEKNGYGIMRAYSRSKLANVLFSAELARRLSGTTVTANCLHPGAVATNIWSHAPWYTQPVLPLAKLFMDSAEKGGGRISYLAASTEVEGQSGGYYEKNHKVFPSSLAQDSELARRLWEVSAALVQNRSPV
jgi:NAD(P)-dependent dehydrogenase (short-subunit alcohol dehydrogenase family)